MANARPKIETNSIIRMRIAELMAARVASTGRDITVQDVSRETGIHTNTLSRLINHPGTGTSTDTIERLCNYFKCPIQDLVELVTDPVRLKSLTAIANMRRRAAPAPTPGMSM